MKPKTTISVSELVKFPGKKENILFHLEIGQRQDCDSYRPTCFSSSTCKDQETLHDGVNTTKIEKICHLCETNKTKVVAAKPDKIIEKPRQS
jgi:hypothetical protein